jgi:hypothetical protein
MSGIGRIQEARETRSQGGSSGVPGREVWFRDGDQAFLSSIATGEEGDTNLDELYMYTYNSGNRWINLLDDPDVDKSGIPDNTRPSHKFAFWAYVHEIIHNERRNDDWEVIQGPGGKKMFKETINDFRIVSLTFGRSDYIWNQLVDIYNDWNGLNKGVMRIKRTGTGMFDTSYQLAATARQDEIPSDEEGKIADLPTVKEYFKSRYGGQPSAVPAMAGVSTATSDDDNELF